MRCCRKEILNGYIEKGSGITLPQGKGNPSSDIDDTGNIVGEQARPL